MLMLITNRHLSGEDYFISTINQALSAGVEYVLLREKDIHAEQLRAYGLQIRAAMSEGQSLIVHSNIEVAKAIEAEGVHLTYADFMKLKVSEIERLSKIQTCQLNPQYKTFSVGVSVHSLDEAIMAERRGASYVLASHVFDTQCKTGLPGRGVAFIHEICNRVSIPVFGLGGIKAENIQGVYDAGVFGVAVMSGIMGSKDVQKSCRELLKTD